MTTRPMEYYRKETSRMTGECSMLNSGCGNLMSSGVMLQQPTRVTFCSTKRYNNANGTSFLSSSNPFMIDSQTTGMLWFFTTVALICCNARRRREVMTWSVVSDTMSSTPSITPLSL
ncbi:hypothetical protein AKO1_004032 [Acrasis kona]|uniref:Uncharacterized protein n=1 Tax=Acrasis kona TaxID=1008807 RepID=A0AAW2ZPV9_9EUKA